MTELSAYALGFAGLVAGGYPAGGGLSGKSEPGAMPESIDWQAAERDFLAGLETMLAGIDVRLS